MDLLIYLQNLKLGVDLIIYNQLLRRAQIKKDILSPTKKRQLDRLVKIAQPLNRLLGVKLISI